MPRVVASHRRFRRRLIAVCVLSLALVSCWKVEPDLEVSTAVLDFAEEKEIRTFTVRNDSEDNSLTSGVTTLEYQVKGDKPWITITPKTGTCGGMETINHTVTVDRSLMPYGANAAILSITSNGGSATIAVQATKPVPGCSDAPTAPSNPSPALGATGVSQTVTLSWDDGNSQCSPLTATYDVYFGDTTPPPFHHNNDSLKVWQPEAPLAPNKFYYWRVVAKDANGATSLARTWTFRTVCTALPTAVVLSSPADNATGVSVNADLAWTGGNSQCSELNRTYDVYFGTTSPPPFVNNTTIKLWDPGTLAKSTTYFWKIIAKDANGSVASTERSFTTEQAVCTTKASAVALVSPANNATNVPVDEDLVWSGGDSQCPGLTATYDVYFGTTTNAPFHHNNGTSKSWDAPLEPSTLYYWRVVAKDSNGSTSSNERSFRTPCNLPPTTPTLITPADDATGVSITDNLLWNNGNSQCSGQTATYDVYFGITSPPPLAGSAGTTKAFEPGVMLPLTKYYWKVVAKDAFGSTSSLERSFTTALVPCTAGPTAVSLQSPADGTTGATLDANIVWTGGNSQCPGQETTYDVYFGTSSPAPFHHNNGDDKNWDPGTLSALTKYYWRVVARDDNGSVSSTEHDFTTGDAPCTLGPGGVTIVAPTNGATDIPTDADISWDGGDSQCAGQTSTFDVYFGTSNPPPFHHNNGPTRSWEPVSLADGTTYYWKIVAKDDNGTVTGPVWSFTTNEPACALLPTTATISTPANGGTNVSIQANLIWTGGNSRCEELTATYDVYFGTSNPPPFDGSNGTSKNFDPGAMQYSTTYYWRIVSKDANGQTEGPVWSFTTEEPCLSAPAAACSPSPTNNRTNVNENADLAWGCGTSQCGLAVTYDVYFGTTAALGEEHKRGSTTEKEFILPKQSRDTKYYWKIVTRDANGSTSSPVWSYTTRD